MTRRALLRAALPLTTFPLALSLSLWRPRAWTVPHGRNAALRVGVLLPAAGDDDADVEALSRGVALGAEESARTASLFGLDVDVVTEGGGGPPDDALAAARRLVAARPAALVSYLEADHCGPIALLARRHDVLVTNVGPAPDAPLPRSCGAQMVHLFPSAATLRRALAVYARGRDAADARGATIAIWHHGLRRFGAEQLNERFRRRFGAAMSPRAWAAWAAMKILTESALRTRSTAGPDLTRHLQTRAARFDGHKGEPLTFDARTGELRQPLYVLRDDDVVAELSIGDVHGASR